MGIFDRFSSGEAGDDPIEEYDLGDLSEEVTVWLADSWPTGKSPLDYDLIFIVDPELEEPILLHCQDKFPMPDGAKILAYDEFVGSPFDETTFYVSRGHLIDPAVAELIDDEYLFAVPKAMQDTTIPPRDGSDSEWVEIFAGLWSGGRQFDKQKSE